MDKNDFRKIMLKKRDSILASDKSTNEKIIFEKFINNDIYIKSSKIFIYVSMGSEVSTIEIINHAISAGKIVAVPKAFIKTSTMIFMQIDTLDNLKRTKLGVLEPLFEERKIVKPDKDTLLVVPGCAFDKRCYRVGYGGGFYDRYIELYKDTFTSIALAFESQIVDIVPTDIYDKKMNYIISEKGDYNGFD